MKGATPCQRHSTPSPPSRRGGTFTTSSTTSCSTRAVMPAQSWAALTGLQRLRPGGTGGGQRGGTEEWLPAVAAGGQLSNRRLGFQRGNPQKGGPPCRGQRTARNPPPRNANAPDLVERRQEAVGGVGEGRVLQQRGGRGQPGRRLLGLGVRPGGWRRLGGRPAVPCGGGRDSSSLSTFKTPVGQLQRPVLPAALTRGVPAVFSN